MIGASAILATISPVSRPGPETPRKRSAPSSASSIVRSGVSWAKPAFSGERSLRPVCTTPLLSSMSMCSRGAPIAINMLRQAMPAAPAPRATMRISSSFLPATRRALVAAAAATIAVPCWSSWKTGMFMRSRQRRSTTKQSGALMSSRLTAPKVGSRRQTRSARRSGSALVDLDVEAVDAGELLEEHGLALHHRLGGLGADVAEAEHGGAVGDHRDEVALGGVAPCVGLDFSRSRGRPRRRRGSRRGRGRGRSPWAWSRGSRAFRAWEIRGSRAPPGGRRRLFRRRWAWFPPWPAPCREA
jgi:hypothetical protein